MIGTKTKTYKRDTFRIEKFIGKFKNTKHKIKGLVWSITFYQKERLRTLVYIRGIPFLDIVKHEGCR